MNKEIYESSFNDELNKLAESNVGCFKGMFGSGNAFRDYIKDKANRKEYRKGVNKVMFKDMGTGALIGLGYGTLASAALALKEKQLSRVSAASPLLSSTLGAVIGGHIGIFRGSYKQNKKVLNKEGITYKGSMFPHDYNYTDAARKKYLV